MTPLKNEIEAFLSEMFKQVPEEAINTVGSEIQKLAESGILDKALKKGDTCTDFSLLDSDNNEIILSDVLRKGKVVLSFFRGTWCPFCNLQFQALNADLDAYQEAGANVILIMPQLPDQVNEWKIEKGYTFSILYDKGNQVADKYGIRFNLPEALKSIYKDGFNIDLPKSNGDESYSLPFPATYVINKEGMITYSFLSPNWMERAEPADVLEAVKE